MQNLPAEIIEKICGYDHQILVKCRRVSKFFRDSLDYQYQKSILDTPISFDEFKMYAEDKSNKPSLSERIQYSAYMKSERLYIFRTIVCALVICFFAAIYKRGENFIDSISEYKGSYFMLFCCIMYIFVDFKLRYGKTLLGRYDRNTDDKSVYICCYIVIRDIRNYCCLNESYKIRSLNSLIILRKYQFEHSTETKEPMQEFLDNMKYNWDKVILDMFTQHAIYKRRKMWRDIRNISSIKFEEMYKKHKTEIWFRYLIDMSYDCKPFDMTKEELDERYEMIKLQLRLR